MRLINPNEMLESCTVIGGKLSPHARDGDETPRRLLRGRYTEWLQWANNYTAWCLTPKYYTTITGVVFLVWVCEYCESLTNALPPLTAGVASKYPPLLFLRTSGQDSRAELTK